MQWGNNSSDCDFQSNILPGLVFGGQVTISPDLLPTFQEWGIQANYFRLRLAMEQCDSDYPCEAWHQYFSGITAVFFTGVPYSDKRCEVPTPQQPPRVRQSPQRWKYVGCFLYFLYRAHHILADIFSWYEYSWDHLLLGNGNLTTRLTCRYSAALC